LGLDGVIAQQANYRKSGFNLAYRNIRHQGEGGGAEPSGLLDLSTVTFDQIVRYDETVFPTARPSFLRCWIRQLQGAAFGIIGEQRLEGYGVLRAGRCGFKIGPLFADDLQIADALFQSLASRVPGKPLFIDTPESNPAAVELAKRHGMKPVFETARMYTKGCPAGRIDHCFGVTTFELG
jgi:Acetyltransferase (GNAT) domain